MEHEFLKEKYGLHKSPEVEKAAKRMEQRTGEKVLQEPGARIQNYLDRLKNVINPPKLEGHSGFDRRERNLEMIKRALYDKFVIKPEEIPESYWESIKQRHREEGHGDIEIPEEQKRELAEGVIEEQRESLDCWIDYLVSPDAKYPDALKYWAIRSVLKMGRYDKEKGKFTERYGGTVSPFPELNQEALALVFAAMEAREKGEQYDFGYDIDEETKRNFLSALQKGNFPKLYALAIEEFNPIPEELLKITDGQWVKYPKGSNAESMVKTLKRRGTGWCIAQTPTAKRYLEGSDLEIFYSRDQEGNFTIPRVVIVESGGRISEARGVAKKEHLDDYIPDVVQKRLAMHPDGKVFEKKTQDMKTLTAIERKSKIGEAFTKDDLIFLYEVNSSIEGFGYQRDPRITELRAQRNPEEDMLVIFECTKDQIARNINEIKQNTKAYVGPLVPKIFDKIQEYDIEHIYTSFPEGRLREEIIKQDNIIKFGDMPPEDLLSELEQVENKRSPHAEDMIKSRDFTILKETGDIVLVRLKVRDLGINKQYPTTDEIYKRIEELGLELCPARIGVIYRLQYQNQPIGEWLWIGMKQIADRVGFPRVFVLGRRADGLWLRDFWAEPRARVAPGLGLVFRLRKLKNLET